MNVSLCPTGSRHSPTRSAVKPSYCFVRYLPHFVTRSAQDTTALRVSTGQVCRCFALMADLVDPTGEWAQLSSDTEQQKAVRLPMNP